MRQAARVGRRFCGEAVTDRNQSGRAASVARLWLGREGRAHQVSTVLGHDWLCTKDATYIVVLTILYSIGIHAF